MFLTSDIFLQLLGRTDPQLEYIDRQPWELLNHLSQTAAPDLVQRRASTEEEKEHLERQEVVSMGYWRVANTGRALELVADAAGTWKKVSQRSGTGEKTAVGGHLSQWIRYCRIHGYQARWEVHLLAVRQLGS